MRLQLLSLASLALMLSIAWIPAALMRVRQFGFHLPFVQLDDAAGEKLTGVGRRLELAYRHLLMNFPPFAAAIMILANIDVVDTWTLLAAWTFTTLRFMHFLLYACDYRLPRGGSYIASLLALFYLTGRCILCLLYC